MIDTAEVMDTLKDVKAFMSWFHSQTLSGAIEIYCEEPKTLTALTMFLGHLDKRLAPFVGTPNSQVQ